jgi:hypothetical protein
VKCCFCHKDKTIKHLFFECHFTRTIWNLIQVATNLYPPCSISKLFNSWLCRINKDLKQLVLLEQHLSVGQFGAIKMTLLFNREMWQMFCKFYTRLLTSSVLWLCFRSLSSRSRFWLNVSNWSKWAGCFCPRHMDGDLVFGLITNNTTTYKVICSGSKLTSVAVSEPLLLIQGYQQMF